jgi:hypothetical protein
MKKYVVAYINFFDNELKMSIQEAKNEVHACKNYLKIKQNENPSDSWVNDLPDNLEELKEKMFNLDSMINAIEI